jgi:hypothetical protein
MAAMLEEYTLTVPEAAAMLDVSEKSIQRLIYTARLDAVRVKGPRSHEFRLCAAEIRGRQEELRHYLADALSETPGPAEACSGSPSPADPSEPELPAPQTPAGTATPGTVEAPPAHPELERFIELYRELFERSEQLGRRVEKLECENRQLREEIQRASEREVVPDLAQAVLESEPPSRRRWIDAYLSCCGRFRLRKPAARSDEVQSKERS